MEKIKQFLEWEKGKMILTILIVILVGLASFQLGRLSKSNNDQGSGIKIEYPAELNNSKDQSANALSATENLQKNSQVPTNSKPTSNTTGYYFASKRGHKYYPLGCSAGKSIKQENRIYFATSVEAEHAGYALSSSCK